MKDAKTKFVLKTVCHSLFFKYQSVHNKIYPLTMNRALPQNFLIFFDVRMLNVLVSVII